MLSPHQLEEEKARQIQAMRTMLYENLHSALREKEMEAMRLKLEVLTKYGGKIGVASLHGRLECE